MNTGDTPDGISREARAWQGHRAEAMDHKRDTWRHMAWAIGAAAVVCASVVAVGLGLAHGNVPMGVAFGGIAAANALVCKHEIAQFFQRNISDVEIALEPRPAETVMPPSELAE